MAAEVVLIDLQFTAEHCRIFGCGLCGNDLPRAVEVVRPGPVVDAAQLGGLLRCGPRHEVLDQAALLVLIKAAFPNAF